MLVESIGRSFYFETFIDDNSRFVHVYFLRSKDDVKSAFLEFKAYIENKLNCKIKTLRTAQGLEYVGPNFDLYLVENGIKREHTCDYTPQVNGIAELENRTLVIMARCLPLQSGLTIKFWAESINSVRQRKQYNIKEEIEEVQIALEDDIPSLKEALNGRNSE
ncbi:Retrovirus-related Pol polyprotein from transposon TNT 1-94 [Araneus ventricosus]|uniref:Retrovirus-related Pol polyprotein from transposon TNT 1-94 n=1 Tax=Araneus ventricosus TaxID=182803 RepID=A0A4Y2A424_ARAVE|nr:Retrovirus-related Pol polyprotein from transposon TNT 1-94 [Araneus ventricosus]